MKIRLDRLLVERGLAESREKAQALIMAGSVLLNGQKATKAGQATEPDAALEVVARPPYVSRGGLKLAAALDHWKIDLTDRACLDIGASTGGFTDCLLQRGASFVTSVDTGFGQIAMKLRDDPRVGLLERTNARFLTPGALARTGFPEPTLMVMDASFISATLLLEPVVEAAPSLQEAIILVKPQFEVGRARVGRGGIVRNPEAHKAAVDRVAHCIESIGWRVLETIPSPITGAEGNQEFLLYARRCDAVRFG